MATKQNITERFVESVQPPAAGRVMIRDATLPGFCLQVTANGAKSFYVVKRIGRKVQSLMLGRWPQVKVGQARRTATDIVGRIAAGAMSVESPRARGRTEATLGEVWDWFVMTFGAGKRTIARDVRVWERDLSDWSNRQLSVITKADVRKRMQERYDEFGQGAARKLLELLRTLYNRAARYRDWDGVNPTAGIPIPRPADRERFLQPNELPRFFSALQSLKSTTARDFFALLLLTGARRSNVASMRWDELHLDAALWIVPAAKYKAKRDNAVVLVPEAVAIIESRRGNGSEFVFPGRGKAGHYACPKDAWRRLCASAGLKNLRIHDLRRTLGSYLAATNASMAIIGKSLGQTSPRATAIYARLSLGPVRDAVGKAVDAIREAGGTEKSENR